MSELDDLRRRIDEMDRRLVELLVDRLQLARAVAREKLAAGLPPRDPQREEEVLASVLRAADGRYPSARLEALYREILAAGRDAGGG